MTLYSTKDKEYFTLHIQGLVQGVGFRPFVYRLANAMQLKGQVENRNDGVFIKINASIDKVKRFEQEILKQAPPASNIHSISIQESDQETFSNFQIIKSTNISEAITQVSPDIAVCNDCLKDMESQENRIDYPFTNCTNCGPRFSIIQELPYDRPFTTMEPFEMCNKCEIEYSDVLDRRFHAQPVACNNCGPVYKLEDKNGSIQSIHEIIKEISEGVLKGKIYAIKGIGGFHIMCDAENEKAVNRIREIKNRDGKPFAIMAASTEDIDNIACVNQEEYNQLISWQKPIVLLKYKGGVAYGVTNGLNKVGVMLPYMPFHYLLFKQLKSRYIVLTSGNISDEPIIIDNNDAINTFDNKVDNIITYNRDIHNRIDDSVCTIVNNSTRIIRRSRGYAPTPILTSFSTEGIFAAGAELTNSFCIGKGNQAIMSQYLGDLKNAETLDFYEETYQRFERLFRFKPQLIVTDMHPDYLSSQFARKIGEKNHVPIINVQHHHAHIASVLATRNLDEEVIGVSFDGIGLGTDKNVWGAEFMVANLNEFERLYHFENIPMPGGDKASKDSWRMAISYLYTAYGNKFNHLKLPLIKDIEPTKIENITQLIRKNINSPLASSAGRLFDTVASIIGVCHYNSFQAESPMRLESLIDESIHEKYNYEIQKDIISFNLMIKEIVKDYNQGVVKNIISTKFHNTIIDVIVKVCLKISEIKNLNKIVLSGGTFQNTYISENTEKIFKNKGFEVFTPKGIPINDQGIALGQLAIAAKRRSLSLF